MELSLLFINQVVCVIVCCFRCFDKEPKKIGTCTHLNSVIGFLVEDGHIRPVQPLDDLDHGIRLVGVRRYRSQEIFESLLITQLGTCRKEAHLKLNRKKIVKFNTIGCIQP
ncbi:hypothetical protein TNIN_10791 [Trichonephila inaurata madagascariensis]|uniref:Uncharacterized protein n=1 Tax=Trichonephila inaurata madagascariensis TaxID=2747483 RepID=A0A8X6XLF9_9ARAC|nr:hypothetical protein TNIN_10791 [Trichonephila inaurata madagascariensis]